MDNIDFKRLGYLTGIGLGIIIVTAFIFSQLIFPIVLGRTPKVETPNVQGMNLLEAKKLMEGEKLHLVVKDSLFSESQPTEAILEQDPPAGEKIRQDGTVYVVISRGSSTVTLPDLSGKSYQEAIISLRNLDLKYAIADSVYSDDYAVNSVVRSVPYSGNKVKKRSTVKLILSRGNTPLPDSTNSAYPVYPMQGDEY